MTITIIYKNQDSLRLPHVQGITLIGPGTMLIKCFGNDSVLHSGVESFDVEPFLFPTAPITLASLTGADRPESDLGD
jgi:hypothetical protein